jgi:TolB-like protein
VADDGPGSGSGAVRPGALTELLRAIAASPDPPEAEATLPRPGEPVGRFEIVREMGRGAFGVVFEARDRELGRSVALKIVRPGKASGEAQLAREAEAIARLSHPNLVTLFDTGRSEHGPYLVFELLRGQTLERQLDEGSVAPAEAVRLASEVARGLAYAHGEGVVHRDLKPSNVFVTDAGQVKLLDFGMAHAFGRRRVSGGTPAYMAPEQWADAPEDERTDVFALGVMLHRLLAGDYPFPEGGGRWSSGETVAARLEVAGAPELGDLVERMLAKTPTERPRDGAEVLKALAPFQDQLATQAAASHSTVTRRRAPLGVLLAELKRRRVFRVLAGYAVAGFAVLQVIEPVMHAYDLPNWVLTAVVTALAAGLPLALALAWIFDLTPQGVRRTPSATGGRPALSRGRVAVALALLALAAAMPVVGWYVWRRSRASASAADAPTPVRAEASIAVLPFANLSGDPENEYFSDGLTEEILDSLAQIPGLRVTARTSSFSFKGKAEPVGRIAEVLHVAHVLEGSVRRASGRVRVTAQLVSAASGFHLWSSTYERDLKDVFAIQEEIAAAIAGKLRLQLAPPAVAAGLKAGGTSNPEALDAYLKGRQALNERTPDGIERAIVAFKRAVALDPSYAVAWADQAVATCVLDRDDYGDLSTVEAASRARPLVERAMALAPERPEVLAAAGLLARCENRAELAVQLLDRAIAVNPNAAEPIMWRAMDLESLDRYTEVIPGIEAAVRADPLSRVALSNLSAYLDSYGREADARRIAERLAALDEPWGLRLRGFIAARHGDRVEAFRLLLLSAQLGHVLARSPLAIVLADLGLREEALRVGPRRDEVLDALGDFEGALREASTTARASPKDLIALTTLVFALERLDRRVELARYVDRPSREFDLNFSTYPLPVLLTAEAARLGGYSAAAHRLRERAQRMIEGLRAAGGGTSTLGLASVYLAAYDGQDDEAATRLASLVGPTTSILGPQDLAWPFLARLRARPDVKAIEKRRDAVLAAQRAQVVAMLCGPERLSTTWRPAPETCAPRAGTGAPR